MQYSIIKHNLKISSCILIILLLGSCFPADAASIKIRGTPGSVKAGSTMNLDAFNFPELYYKISNNQTYEWLNISFAENGVINEGGASYTTKVYSSSSKTIMFMGSKYYPLDTDKAYMLSTRPYYKKEKTFSLSEVCEISQNYTFAVLDIDHNGEQATLQLTKDGEVVKLDVVEANEKFEYKIDIGDSEDITIFTCKVDAMLHGTDFTMVKLKSIKLYSETPLIIGIGDKFGDFEITSITDDMIEMKNSKQISCPLDKSVDLLDDWLDLKVSEKGYWGYVYTTKTLDCPEPTKASSVTESTDDVSTTQNTTASNTPDDTVTKTETMDAAVPPATPDATSDAASAKTTKTEQPVALASVGVGGTATRTLPAPGVVSLVSLFAILAFMNFRKK